MTRSSAVTIISPKRAGRSVVTSGARAAGAAGAAGAAEATKASAAVAKEERRSLMLMCKGKSDLFVDVLDEKSIRAVDMPLYTHRPASGGWGGYDLQCLHRGEDRAGNILYESRGLVTLILTPPKHLFQGMSLA